jgi:lysophospholipase L1-like esterase
MRGIDALVVFTVTGAMLAPGTGAAAQDRWVATWATAPMPADAGSAIPASLIKGATIRQNVRVSVGGGSVRLRLTNRFGSAPLRIDKVRVGVDGGTSSASQSRQVTFGGSDQVIIPAGADYVSDPVELPVNALATLAISFHLPEAPAVQTVHYVSKSTSYVTGANGTGSPFEHWYQLAGVDVKVTDETRVVAVLGDSITDGHASGADRNERWTDVLAGRLQAQPATRTTSVLNLGMSGNRLLKEGSGPSGMARFSYDVLDQPGLTTLVVFEGSNDIGKLSREGPVTTAGRREVVTGLIAAYRQLIEQAHLRGIRVVGATLLPFGGTAAFRSDADAMADREAVNAWIRGPGHFDAVIDFDALMRDPAHPERLRPAYDSGDLLHPSVAGYRAMGQAVPLGVFLP